LFVIYSRVAIKRFSSLFCVAFLACATSAAPGLIAPGVISTVDDEAGGALTPDGNDFYFAKFAPYTTAPRLSLICVSHRHGARWSEPQAVPFSGQYLDLPPRLSPDGKTLLFGSTRPIPGSDAHGIHLWQVTRTSSGWSAAQPLPPAINAPGVSNLDASVASDGTLYLTTDAGSANDFHISVSHLSSGQYSKPERLPAPVHSGPDNIDVEPFIAPDQSYLLFVSQWTGQDPRNKRPQELIAGGSPYPRGDIYISYHKANGWTPPRHLENGINSFAEEAYPTVTADGKSFIFSSERSSFNIPQPHSITWAELERKWHSILNGRGNIYRVPMSSVTGGSR